MSKFSIDSELLGIVVYLSRRLGPDVGQSGSIWFLREIHDQLKPENIESHLTSLMLDCLPYDKRNILREHIIENRLFTKEENRYFRDVGILYGEVPQIPQAIIKRIHVWYDWMYA